MSATKLEVGQVWRSEDGNIACVIDKINAAGLLFVTYTVGIKKTKKCWAVHTHRQFLSWIRRTGATLEAKP